MTTPTSDLYNTLVRTATNFLESCQPSPPGSNTPNKAAILSNLAPDFHISYGHTNFVSTAPMLQGMRSGEEFADRTAAAGLYVRTWDVKITDVIVDEVKRRVVVRSDFITKVVEGKEDVLNDMLIFMRMDERGEKLVECTEFPDPTATAKMQHLLTGGGQ